MLHYNGYHPKNGVNVVSLVLAMQEYNFEIVHRKGSLNVNEDALSGQNPSCTTTLAMTHHSPLEVLTSQHAG